MTLPAGDLTVLLRSAARGSEDAARQLMPLVHAELRALAGGYMRGERRGHTLQPTALVNEALLRLLAGRSLEVRDRAHFFALAARAMRHVLVDHARERAAAKRGDGVAPISLDDPAAASVAAPDGASDIDVLALHEALGELARIHERQARVVEMRWFGGSSVAEIAEVLEVSTGTVDNDWAAARAWLFTRLASW
jgi:RNA polymerase sigma-70 factor (ECF subfamily)